MRLSFYKRIRTLAASVTGLLLFLILKTSAYAQVNLCDSTNESFGALCNIRADRLNTIVPNIINILLIISVVLAIVFIIWGGIRWIKSGGDKAAVEQARSTIVAALVGLVLAFLAFFIITVVMYLFGLGSPTDIALPRLV